MNKGLARKKLKIKKNYFHAFIADIEISCRGAGVKQGVTKKSGATLCDSAFLEQLWIDNVEVTKRPG
jgi:hypothetical protein